MPIATSSVRWWSCNRSAPRSSTPSTSAMPDDLGKHELEVLLYEFKTDVNVYLASLGPGAPVKSLKEAIAFNDANRDREMPFFGQELFVRRRRQRAAHLTGLPRRLSGASGRRRASAVSTPSCARIASTR